MKYFFLFFPLLLLLLVGCSEESDSVFEPDDLKSFNPKGFLICHQHGPNSFSLRMTIDESDWPEHESHGDVRLDDQDGDGYVPENGCKYYPMGDCDDQNRHLHPDVEHEVIIEDGTSIFVHPYSDYRSLIWSPDMYNFLPMDYFNGLINTNRIVEYYDDQKVNRQSYAAGYCKSLSNDDCTWYLPSSRELVAMYRQLGPIDNGYKGQGIMTEGLYWSSTESAQYPNQAFAIEMSQGWPGTFARGGYQLKCKCVRK